MDLLPLTLALDRAERALDRIERAATAASGGNARHLALRSKVQDVISELDDMIRTAGAR